MEETYQLSRTLWVFFNPECDPVFVVIVMCAQSKRLNLWSVLHNRLADYQTWWWLLCWLMINCSPALSCTLNEHSPVKAPLRGEKSPLMFVQWGVFVHLH